MSKNLDLILSKLAKASRQGDLDTATNLFGELADIMKNSASDDLEQFIQTLERAVDAFDRKLVSQLCESFVEALWKKKETCSYEIAEQVLNVLRRKRHFKEIVRVGEALLQSGQDAPRVRRQYAQALIERGQIAGALCILENVRTDCKGSRNSVKKAELFEAVGLIGRAHKQIYISSSVGGGAKKVRSAHLREAIASYTEPYKKDEANVWHGINAVALLERAKRDKVRITNPPLSAKETAQKILTKITAQEKIPIWEVGTVGEAFLALGDYENALEWIVEYTNHAEGDAFEFGSTLRQFEEVWNLSDRNPDHARILNVLRSAVLEKEGGSVTLPHPAEGIAAAENLIGDSAYEAVLGEDRYQKYALMVKGLNQARIVARVEKQDGNGHGTGFLLPGSQVHESITDEWVLVTNSHVVSLDPVEQAGVPAALPPDEVRIRFEAWENSKETHSLGKILYTSPRSKLDYSVVALRSEIKFAHEFDIPKRLPRADGNQRVYVVGHPRGGGLSVSLHDNALLDHEAPLIHYRAPTEGGSSGSPVFNSAWNLIGLHHAGGMEMKRLNGKSGLYPANEGIWIHSVLKSVAASFESSN